MRNVILILCLLLTGCDHQPTHYRPVNWDQYDPGQQQPPQPRPFPPPPPPSAAPTVNQQLLELHNKERELKGRAAAQMDESLNQYAQAWAENMAKRNSLYHSKLTFMSQGSWTTGGENIAWNQQTPEEVVNAWMHSPGHRANILNRSFTKIGFGVARNGRDEPYWCTVFGGP